MHDQLGSTEACFNANGDQSDEYTYDAWGQAFWSQVLLDGHPRNVSSVAHDGLSGITSVTMNDTFANDPTNAVILGPWPIFPGGMRIGLWGGSSGEGAAGGAFIDPDPYFRKWPGGTVTPGQEFPGFEVGLRWRFP